MLPQKGVRLRAHNYLLTVSLGFLREREGIRKVKIKTLSAASKGSESQDSCIDVVVVFSLWFCSSFWLCL